MTAQIIVHVTDDRWLTLAAGAVTGIVSAVIGATAVLVAQGRAARTQRDTDRLARLEAFVAAAQMWATFASSYPSEDGKGPLDKITTRRDIIRHEGRLLERAWALSDQLWRAAVEVIAVADDEETAAIKTVLDLTTKWKLGDRGIASDSAWLEATAVVVNLAQRRRLLRD